MWPIIQNIWDFLVSMVFGSEILTALFLVFFAFVMLLAARVDFKFSFLAIAPLTYALAGSGFLGAAWIQGLVILVLSVFWAFVIWRMVSR